MTNYSLGEHRHRYAAWAAAQAAKRRFLGWRTNNVREAIESVNLHELASDPATKIPQTHSDYAKAHDAWCSEIAGKLSCTYGRAAKVVAIYLKTITMGLDPNIVPAMNYIHPPIDSILLNALLRGASPAVRALERRWTQFSKEDYDAVMEKIIRPAAGKAGLWQVEQNWTP